MHDATISHSVPCAILCCAALRCAACGQVHLANLLMPALQAAVAQARVIVQSSPAEQFGSVDFNNLRGTKYKASKGGGLTYRRACQRPLVTYCSTNLHVSPVQAGRAGAVGSITSRLRQGVWDGRVAGTQRCSVVPPASPACHIVHTATSVTACGPVCLEPRKYRLHRRTLGSGRTALPSCT